MALTRHNGLDPDPEGVFIHYEPWMDDAQAALAAEKKRSARWKKAALDNRQWAHALIATSKLGQELAQTYFQQASAKDERIATLGARLERVRTYASGCKELGMLGLPASSVAKNINEALEEKG